MRILFCGNTFPDAPEYLREQLPAECNDEILTCSDSDILSKLSGVDVVIPKMQRIGSREIEAGQFRLIQQWGAGLEGIDLESAKRKGIYVSNVSATGGNAESVAEHAMLLILVPYCGTCRKRRRMYVRACSVRPWERCLRAAPSVFTV